MDIDLRLGNCLHVLKEMDDNSVDSIVCDPPYGLLFMQSKWDYDVPSVEIWRECLRVLKHGGHLLAFSGTRTYHRVVVNIEDAGFEIRDQIQWIYGEGFPKSLNVGGGWGTQLKPANEPICLARKPLIGKVVDNMDEYGTGAMNIDGCRIEEESRWPANVIFDEKAAGGLEQSRYFYCIKANQNERNAGCDNLPLKLNENSTYGMQTDEGLRNNNRNPENRTREQRNNHPTVKPIDLMRYLCRLITPPEGIVLDPFMGSGTTGIAACLEGFKFVGIELNEDYLEIARHRIAHWGDYEITESDTLIPQKRITEWL